MCGVERSYHYSWYTLPKLQVCAKVTQIWSAPSFHSSEMRSSIRSQAHKHIYGFAKKGLHMYFRDGDRLGRTIQASLVSITQVGIQDMFLSSIVAHRQPPMSIEAQPRSEPQSLHPSINPVSRSAYFGNSPAPPRIEFLNLAILAKQV